MSEYRCISCGSVRDSKKTCSCLKCGYKMFPTPYDKKEVLISEITGFVKRLTDIPVSEEAFSYFRIEVGKDGKKININKCDDDKRFPTFCQIQDYVCSSERTEVFIKRLLNTIEQLEKHFFTPYNEEYEIDFGALINNCQKHDKVLKKALNILKNEASPAENISYKAKAFYSEIPDTDILPYVEKTLELLKAFVEKINRFIKQNSIYGKAFQVKGKNTIDSKRIKSNCKSVLEENIEKLIKALSSEYTVDIFSDGFNELQNLLKIVWNSLYLIMNAPVFIKNFTYSFGGDNTRISSENFFNTVSDILHLRYDFLVKTMDSDNYLNKFEEKELFDIYNQMILIDEFGYIGVNKSDLNIPGENEKQLEKLIGLSSVKESIKKIKAYALANKKHDELNLHMCFLGNPGTGKTEVARIIAGILYENNILPTKNVVEVDRGGLISQYVGETAIKTAGKIDEAMGGVLFIDEAYSLFQKDSGFDYGHEAVATLIKAMEDYRGKFCVILAGYRNQMNDMIESNPGFRSRIQFEIDFPNYSREELGQITRLMLKKRKYSMADDALGRILDITDIKRKNSNFANAREVRNILDQVIMCQNIRTGAENDKEIGLVDVNKYIADSKLNVSFKSNKIDSSRLTAEDELERLIGLTNVKRMIKKIKAYAKRNREDSDFNLHMSFFGNPGTGKTEVARLLSQILYEAGVLSEAKMVETDAHGLIGKYVGETAPKTLEKIREAMGGVLFIDEAYSLSQSANQDKNYGDEALSVLLKEMEDNRGQFCVIFAGYQEEISRMLSSNPGLSSRIQFNINFDDYSRSELGEIAILFANKKGYSFESSALQRFLDVVEYYRGASNFANARTVRNVLDQVIMNQNLRTEDCADGSEEVTQIIIDDVNDYIADENIDIVAGITNNFRIGFI